MFKEGGSDQVSIRGAPRNVQRGSLIKQASGVHLEMFKEEGSDQVSIRGAPRYVQRRRF